MPATHKAIIVAETTLVWDGLSRALEEIGAPAWLNNQTSATSDAELLVEFAGRLCYKSFEVGLNPNVTRVREGNDLYIENVLKQAHGSVFEHATTTFALLNVSRIFTHELVRHRQGTAYSQESQRFVRLDDFQLYIPDLTEALMELAPDYNSQEWVQEKQDQFVLMADEIKTFTVEKVSGFIQELGLDADGVKFHVKKAITSALRRLIPGGVNTNILITANHRAWRFMIQQRTSDGAEVEIQEVFVDIANQMRVRYPNIYADMVLNNIHTKNGYHFINHKV
jgi:thymidylate synthase (FAD)